MSTIRVIYHGVAPDFPATDQHPAAVRYGPIVAGGGEYFVDAIDGEPTAEEILAVLNPPPPVPASISDRQFFQQLAIVGLITQADALAAVRTGTVPTKLQSLLGALPTEGQFSAEMLLCGATVFERAHPLTVQLGHAQGMDDAQLDDFFRAAAAL